MYGYGNSFFLTTRAILAESNAAVLPVNTVAPVISGSTSLGSVLSSTTGTWTGTPTITFAYQWYRGATLITGATSSTYTIVVADSAAALTCQVTATNSAGSVSATSNAITAQTFTAPVNTVAPALSGTAQEGQTLTCSTGTWTGNPTPTYSYQWKRNGSNIGSATNSTYTLVTADVGQSIKCTVTATNAISSVNADSNTVTPTSAVDPDAQAFITAAAITNPTQQSAINTLVVDLKGYNIWTKFKALYPFVGGTNTKHTWNLKNTAQFQISWIGGATSSANGVQFNGTNSYGDTSYLPITQASQNNHHVSIYSRTNTTGVFGDIGAANNNTENARSVLFPKLDSNAWQSLNSNGYLQWSNANSLGHYISNRTSSNIMNGWKDGVKKGTQTNASITPAVNNYFIGATSLGALFGVAGFYSNRQLAFASIGDGLTDTEAANFYTAVQTFQTTLGRQV